MDCEDKMRLIDSFENKLVTMVVEAGMARGIKESLEMLNAKGITRIQKETLSLVKELIEGMTILCASGYDVIENLKYDPYEADISGHEQRVEIMQRAYNRMHREFYERLIKSANDTERTLVEMIFGHCDVFLSLAYESLSILKNIADVLM